MTVAQEEGVTLDDLNLWLESQSSRSQTVLTKFRAEFDKDPARAFEWSAQAFTAAAEQAMIQKVLAVLRVKRVKRGGDLLQRIAEEARTIVLMGASNPPRSTSTPSNEMELEHVAAWARLLEFLQRGY